MVIALGGFAARADSTLTNSFAEHPLAYFVVAGLGIAMLLYLIFDTKSTLGQSVFFAAFSSPISITVFALVLGYGLDTELPTLVADNHITIGGYSSGEISRAIAVGIASLLWLFLMAKWAAGRSKGPRTKIAKERPLSADGQRVADGANRYSVRADRDARGRKLPPPR